MNLSSWRYLLILGLSFSLGLGTIADVNAFVAPISGAQDSGPRLGSATELERPNLGNREGAGWWHQFRGPSGMGVAVGCRDLPIRMGANENVVWNVAVPGTGWSSPVVDDELIWMTTAVTDSGRPGSDAGNANGLDLVLLAFERGSGQQRHFVKLFHMSQPDLIHSLNSYASPTPCLDQDHVYCHFGTYGTAAVRRKDGTIAWANREIQLQHATGPGSSPILFQDLLIFHADGMDSQGIVALDCETGHVRWRTERSGAMSESPDQKKAFCTPLIATIEEQALLISPAANWLYVYDPATGRERFKVPYGETGYSVVPRPVVRGNLAYFCTGFDQSRLLCVDVSPLATGLAEDRIQWTVDQRMPTMPSPLLVDDWLYLISDAGIATCVNADSGEVVWSERLGGKFAASPLLADGKIYVGNQAGDLFVLRPGRELDVVASNQLDSAIMASPVAIGQQIIVRTAERLYLFQQR
ncbi:MAG: PQQ-binding-like beta-propeller repeat protein [Pirellulaceae bacterium]|nr:PQQ-binding-like beta-propeller repeat protein [Pirellulaceae bacterium]